MPTQNTTGSQSKSTAKSARGPSAAREQILKSLKDDHQRVKKAYKAFQKLDPEDDTEDRAAIVRQVLSELQVHASLEEELLYPAARSALSDEDLLNEAAVEHESMHTLIGQLSTMDADDPMFAARFTVLCEYALHHAKEEEGEMFPQLESAKLDWENLAEEMTGRRAELSGTPAEDGGDEATPQRANGTGAAKAGTAGKAKATGA